MNIRKLIEDFRGQIQLMEATVEQLERLEGMRTGVKKRGRPPLPKCENGCGRPIHRMKRRRLFKGKVTRG